MYVCVSVSYRKLIDFFLNNFLKGWFYNRIRCKNGWALQALGAISTCEFQKIDVFAYMHVCIFEILVRKIRFLCIYYIWKYSPKIQKVFTKICLQFLFNLL